VVPSVEPAVQLRLSWLLAECELRPRLVPLAHGSAPQR